MKKLLVVGLAVLVGGLGLWLAGFRIPLFTRRKPEPPPVCYDCLWKDRDFRSKSLFIEKYRQHVWRDSMAKADVAYIIWRASRHPDCAAREGYREVARRDPEGYRRFLAQASLGFSAPECGEDPAPNWRAAASEAGALGLRPEEDILRLLARGGLAPRFEELQVAFALDVPPGAASMILGESSIEIQPRSRIGTQVDRVVRDWMSFNMHSPLGRLPAPAADLLDYHEGHLVRAIAQATPAEIYPLAGVVVARHQGKWYAPDEHNVFRFEILDDKMQYPTTHATGEFGWVEDTHGISNLVPQAIGRRVDLVVGCGDSEGKALAAFYLAQKGVNVAMAADRYEDRLLGYQARGVILGTAPIRRAGETAVLGRQPVRFSLRESIVVQDTRAIYPVQYYDAPARYFRRLSQFVPLKLEFVEIDDADQIQRVLDRATRIGATAVAVRVATQAEDEALRRWLDSSSRRRAILFHSGLYPYAQPLFERYPKQVTFGDLRPRFE